MWEQAQSRGRLLSRHEPRSWHAFAYSTDRRRCLLGVVLYHRSKLSIDPTHLRMLILAQRILPSEYYTSTLLVSRADQRVLKDLVAKLLPKMHNHFEDLGVELEAVTFGWFLSLFSLPLPIRVGVPV